MGAWSPLSSCLCFSSSFSTSCRTSLAARASCGPWPSRQIEASYTTPETASDLAALDRYLTSFGPAATFLDFSNERALYYLLRRKPPVRCPDMMMLSAPPLLAEAMAQLRAKPPSCVVLEGYVDPFDGIPSRERAPEIARWIDANYPRRVRFGRFLVATRY